jgi:Outer membrane protein beta-barrel domain
MRGLTARAVTISAACLAFAAPSFGEEHHRTEVFGSAGWGRWWDNEGAPAGGVNFGGGMGRRLLPQFAIEGEVNVFRGTRGYPGQPPPYRARGFHLMGNGLLYVFRGERAQVFVLLGAGAAHSTTEMNFGGYHDSRTGSGFIANAGAGMKIFISQHVALRPEVRLIAGSAGSSVIEPFSAELRCSLGVGYHW